MIDARSLHNWLGIKLPFHKWMSRRIDDYGFECDADYWTKKSDRIDGFEEGADFCCDVSKTKGRPRTDYLLTLDTAKELAMVERTEIGRDTRRYFIQMEKAAVLPDICKAGARAGWGGRPAITAHSWRVGCCRYIVDIP